MSDKNNDNPLDLSYDANYTSAKDVAEEELKKAQARNTMIIVSIIALVIGYFVYQNWHENSNLDYIDGNILKIPRTGTPSTGIPWKNDSFITYLTFASVFETDSEFVEINPYLAESYDVSSDGLTYNIYLKDNLKWSDGTPLTVDDIVWSIETFLLNSSTNSNITNAFTKILGADEWKEVGVESWENGGTHNLEGLSTNGNVLTIELSIPHMNLPLALTQFVPLPKHMLEDLDPTTMTDGIEFFTNPVSSGMYMTTHIDDDNDLVLTHNPNYVKEEVSDIETIVLYGDYENTHIGYYTTSNITEMVSYRSMPGFQEFEVDVNFYRYFVFNLTQGGFDSKELIAELDEDGNEVLDEDGNVNMIVNPEPIIYEEGDIRPENTAMQDIRVRQAISLAIDRESYLKDAYLGTGLYDFSDTGNSSYSSFLSEYNIEKAKALLLESDYDLSRPLVIGYYHKDNNSAVYLSKVKDSLESIGFEEVVLKLLTSDDLYTHWEFDMYMKAYSAFSTIEWYNEYASTNAQISTLTGSGEFDALLDNINAAKDPESYTAALNDLKELDESLMLKLPLYTLNEMVYINSNRVYVPDDLDFCSARVRCNLRLEEWYIKKA